MTSSRALAQHRFFTLPWLALGYGVMLCLVYLPFAEVGFVVDYTGWKERIDAGGLAGAFHTYDFPAHLQAYALMMWSIERLRVIHPLLVQVLLCASGGLAAAAAARLIATEAARLPRVTGPRSLGVLTGLLWVLSPGGTETYILKVCPHYILSAALWALSLYHLGRYFDGGSRRHVWVVLVCQGLGLVTLELAYAMPLALAVYLLWRHAVSPNPQPWRAWLVVGGTAALVGLHLLATKLVYGSWIGHYGAEVATALPLTEVLAGPWRWLARTLGQLRFWSYETRTDIGQTLAEPLSLIALYGASLAAAVVAASQLRRQRRRTWHLGVLLLALAGVAAAPISQLYYYDLQLIENDRLGYLVSLFAYGFAVVALAAIGGRVFWIGGMSLLLVNAYFLLVPLEAWRVSHATLVGLVDSARELSQNLSRTDTVLLVGYANSVRGAPVFSDIEAQATGFGSHVGVMYPDVAWPAFAEVAQFNQQTLTDSVRAEWGNGRLYVSLASDGGWWWHKQYGLGPYTSPDHAFRVEPQPYHFELFLADTTERRRVCWYQQGTTWAQLMLPPE